MKNPTYPKCYAKFIKFSLDKMKFMVSRSAEIEYGSTICMDRDRKINLGTTCKGDSCGVLINKGCKIGREIGEFHTHPDLEIPPFPNDIPSPVDWYRWISRNHFLSCLGSKKGINCYQAKYDLDSNDINRLKSLAKDMELVEVQIQEDPDEKSALKRFLKYNEEIENYFYKFEPEECKDKN